MGRRRAGRCASGCLTEREAGVGRDERKGRTWARGGQGGEGSKGKEVGSFKNKKLKIDYYCIYGFVGLA